MDIGTVTAAGVAALVVKEIFMTVRTVISSRNGNGDIGRAERLATVETKVLTIEKEQGFIKKAVYQMRSAMLRKGWIK